MADSKPDIKIVSGVGDPSSPLYGQLLSEEEEKRIDEKGNPVVHGLTWGDSGTGLYLVVVVSGPVPKADLRQLGGQCTSVPRSLCGERHRRITIATFRGLPRFSCPYVGAGLELPSDLGKDPLKRQYVVEWLVETCVEALNESGVKLGNNKQQSEELALWAAMTAQSAIERTGL